MTRLNQKDVHRLYRVTLSSVEAGSKDRGDWRMLIKLAKWLTERGWHGVPGPGELEFWATEGETALAEAAAAGFFNDADL